MKYLVGVVQSSESIGASIYDPENVPIPSGVMFFVLEAESKEEALFLGKKNWEDFKEESNKLHKLHSEQTGQLYRKFKLLGYHEE